MAEYIEKMKAISAIRSYEFGHCPEYMQDWATKLKRAILQDVVDDVMKIPAADVEPVRHGRWLITKRYDDVIDMEVVKFTCSVCGEYRLTATNLSQATNYCPNCGCKMDLEVSDG